MTDFFFKRRIYFETSFIIPESIPRDILQKGVDVLTNGQFKNFMYLVDEEHMNINGEESKSTLELEDIHGETIDVIHQHVINKCKEDHMSAFRIFWATDSQSVHYLVIHAHHGVADGFMVTHFARCLFAEVTNASSKPEPFVFSHMTPVDLIYPPHWNTTSQDSIIASAEECVKCIHPASVYPLRQSSANPTFINKELVIPKEITQRAVTYAKNCGMAIGENGCIHGMLLTAYLRGLLFAEKLQQSGEMTINTIVNMRRYAELKGKRRIYRRFPFYPPTSCVDNQQPDVFVGFFPISVSVEGLLSQEEHPGTIQHKVTESLNAGLPLAMKLVSPEQIDGTASDDQVLMEMSNLGLHPKDCFTRRLITQTVYEQDVGTLSVVVWTDREGCFHFCCASSSAYMDENRVDRFLGEFSNQLFEFGVI